MKLRLMALCLVVVLVVSGAFIGCGSKDTNEPAAEKQETNKEKSEEPAPSKDKEATKEKALDYPKQSIEVIVPFSAGGGTDTHARLVSGVLEKEVGQSMTVINKPGAGGALGTEAIAKGKPDGYHIGVVADGDMLLASKIAEDRKFDIDSFEYIAKFNLTSVVLVLKKDSPFNDFQEFVEYAKENPGKVSVSTSGVAHTYALIQIEEMAGIDLTEVKYSGAGENLNAVLGGHVDAALLAPKFIKQTEEQGLKTIGVATKERFSLFPDVPTFKEMGYDIIISLGRVFMAPKGTPKEIINYLGEKAKAISEDPSLKEKIEKSGDAYDFMYGEELDTHMKEYAERIDKMLTGKEDLFRSE